MRSIFEQAALRASTAIDAVHGRRIRFTPKARVDNFGKPLAVDGRTAIEFVGGIVEGRSGFEFLAGDKRNSEFSAQSVNEPIYATIDRRCFPDPNNQPRKGDGLTTLDAPIETFEILDVTNDGPARFAMPLVRAP